MNQRQALDEWIGRNQIFEPDVITPRLSREYAATFGDTLARVPGVAPGLHWSIAPTIANTPDLGPDGHPAKGVFLPPIPLPRRMLAGGSIEFFEPLLPGDTVYKTSEIRDIAWKNGRSGSLCFVTVATQYATDRCVAIREQQHIVYREAAKRAIATGIPDAANLVFDVESRAEITSTLLFRYSALTFNGHRIHYDLRYAQQEEKYPDLVIHGPLQATLLLNLAASVKSALPKRFEFHAVAPATGSQTLKIGAVIEGDDCDLKVVSAQNVVTMAASARW